MSRAVEPQVASPASICGSTTASRNANWVGPALVGAGPASALDAEFVQNLRCGHYLMVVDAAPVFWLATVVDEFGLVI